MAEFWESAPVVGDTVDNADWWKQVPPAFETPLNSAEESTFQEWKQKVAPNDSGADYDLRGAFKAGLQPDPQNGHWPDTFKKPNHPTFSDQSIYAGQAPDLAGTWEGDKYIPAKGGDWWRSAPLESFNPRNEQIRAAPTFFGELQAGRFGSAYHEAKNYLANALAPGQEIERGRGEGLLGTKEQIPDGPPPPGMDPLQAKLARAVINVTNRTMAGLTGPGMLPLTVIGGAGGVTGRLLAGAFGLDMASHAPEVWEQIKKADKTEPWSQERLETGLDTILQSLMLAGAAKHAATPTKPVIPSAVEGPRPAAIDPQSEILNLKSAINEGGDTYAKKTTETGPAEAIDFVPEVLTAETARFQGEAAQGAIEPPGPRPLEEPGRADQGRAQDGARQTGLMPAGSEPGHAGRVQGTAPPDRQSAGDFAEPKSAAGLPPDRAAGGGLTDAGTPQTFKSFGELPAVENGGSRIADSQPSSIRNPPSSLAEGEVPFGFGPGAASAQEPLARYELRKFATRLQEDYGIAKDLRENIGNRYYEPIPNKVTSEQAMDLINERGPIESIKIVMDEANGIEGRVRGTMGQLIMKRLNETYQNLKPLDPAAAADVLNHKVDISEWMQEFGTRSGQTVQSFAMWSTLSADGKLLQLQRDVQKARKRHGVEHGEEVKEILDGVGDPKLTRTQREIAFRGLFKTNPTARKLKTKETRLLEAAKTGLLDEKTFYDIASDRLGLPVFDKHVATEISRMAAEIDAAPEGMPRDRLAGKLSRFIASKTGFDPVDLPTGIYYGNMLSGYQTQIVNTVDTFLNVLSEVNGLAVANPRSAAKIYSGALRGFLEGRVDALQSLTSGRMVTDGKWLEVPRLMEVAEFGKKGGVPIKTGTRGGRILKAVAESKPAAILNGWKYVTRLMAASDALMYRTAKESRMALLADRVAREEGLHGVALDRRVEKILGTDELALIGFEKQASAEGFTGRNLTARTLELREQSRGKDATADAADFAGVATYNHKPTGWLGHVALGIENTLKPFPLAKVIFVPFTRIVANVTNRGLNYTPEGFRRAWYERPGSDARAAHLARATFGTAGMGILMALQASGKLDINGAGPTDHERRKQLEAAGWKPYSVKIGDTYFSYLYTPIGLGLSIIGNMTDSQRYKELDQKDAVTRGVYAFSRIGSTIFSQSFLSGLSTLFRALSSDPGGAISSIKNILSSTAGTATTPNIIRDVHRLFDRKRYQSDTIQGDLLRNTPFAAAVNRPALNAFGESIDYPSSRFVSQLTDDPAWRIVVKMNLHVPVPDKYTLMPDGHGGRRRITPDEYYEYLHLTGPKLKAAIAKIGDRWYTVSPEIAQKKLSIMSEQIREGALSRLRHRAAGGKNGQ